MIAHIEKLREQLNNALKINSFSDFVIPSEELYDAVKDILDKYKEKIEIIPYIHPKDLQIFYIVKKR